MKRVMIRLVKYLMSIVVFDVCLWMLLCRKIGILFIKCMYLINYSLYHRTIITFFSGYPFLIKSYNSIQKWTFKHLIFLFFVLPIAPNCLKTVIEGTSNLASTLPFDLSLFNITSSSRFLNFWILSKIWPNISILFNCTLSQLKLVQE